MSYSQPKLTWNFAAPDFENEGTNIVRVLRQWHQASGLGFRIENLTWAGRPLSEQQIERLNLWLSAGAAGQRLTNKEDYWSAFAILEKILFGASSQPVLTAPVELYFESEAPVQKKPRKKRKLKVRKYPTGPAEAQKMRDFDEEMRRDPEGLLLRLSRETKE